jgi:hypothetical protein
MRVGRLFHQEMMLSRFGDLQHKSKIGGVQVFEQNFGRIPRPSRIEQTANLVDYASC